MRPTRARGGKKAERGAERTDKEAGRQAGWLAGWQVAGNHNTGMADYKLADKYDDGRDD